MAGEELVETALDTLKSICEKDTADPYERRMAAEALLGYVRDNGEPTMTGEGEFYDDDTLLRARLVLINDIGFLPESADNVITVLLNAGFLFRERR